MELRQDRQERWFWGCTEFTNPDSRECCYLTRPIRREEQEYLEHGRDQPPTQPDPDPDRPLPPPPHSRGRPVPLTAPPSSAAYPGQPEASHGSSQELVEALRTWRRGRTEADEVPAFVILHDTTLFAIAEARPASEADLVAIRGIGPGLSRSMLIFSERRLAVSV